MQQQPGITHNPQPREENVYALLEGELDSLASFQFMGSILGAAALAILGFVLSHLSQINGKWDMVDVGVAVGGSVSVVILLIWCWREVTQGKSLLKRIKEKPRSKPNRNGNGA